VYVKDDKELKSDRFLPKRELKKFFGTGKVKLKITKYKTKYRKPHDRRSSAGIRRTFWRTKSEEVILY